MKYARRRLTYANVMSSLAVFLVLAGGTALAAGLAKNSVGPKQLKKGAVTAAKIKDGAVGAGKLASGAVTGDKLAPGSVGSAQLAPGSVGAAQLAPGAIPAQLGPGSVGAANLGPITVRSAEASIGNTNASSVNVLCLPGERAISGGASWSDFGTEVVSSRPIKDGEGLLMANGEVPAGWRAGGKNNSGSPQTLTAWVVCLK